MNQPRALPLVALSLVLAGGASCAPRPKTTRSLAQRTDAGAAAVAVEDASPNQDEAAAAPLAPKPALPTAGPGRPRGKVHDRVVVKIDGADPIDEARVEARIEEETGLEVLDVQGGPGRMLVVTFAPTDPPRDAARQAELVARLKASRAFAFVEPDAVMTVR